MLSKTSISRTLSGLALSAAMISLGSPARADLTFYTDPGAYQSDLSALGRQDETVDFNDPGLITQGPTVTGDAAGDIIRFQDVGGGGEDLVTPSGGQARIEAVDGGLNSLFITPDQPGAKFTALQANPDLFTGDTGFATVTVKNEDAEFSYDLGSGQNFFGIIATHGQSFESVYLQFWTDSTMTTPLDIQDVRQVRVEVSPSAVPEPAFYQMGTLLGLGGFALLRRRRTKRS